MSTCKYCNRSAGFFHSVHKECEEKHISGLSELEKMLCDYIFGNIDSSELRTTIMNLRRCNFIIKDDAIRLVAKIVDEAVQVYGWNLNITYKQRVMDLLQVVRLTENEVNYNGCLNRLDNALAQKASLSSIQNGILPQPPSNCPILLVAGETIVTSYNEVTMLQEKVEKEYQGRRSGWSFRVMKGVNYHVGGSNMKPVEHNYMKEEGVGILYVTNKNLVFHADTVAIRVPYKKIVGITPCSDGIVVHRDGSNAKRLVFQGFDSRFLMQILPYINS